MDGSIGQAAFDQAKAFHDSVDVSLRMYLILFFLWREDTLSGMLLRLDLSLWRCQAPFAQRAGLGFRTHSMLAVSSSLCRYLDTILSID